MSIPVQNLYYLLTYAWDERLRQGGMTELEAAACPNLNTLLGRVLLHGTRELLRRGLDRSYVLHEELTSRIRGRIDFPRSARQQTWREGKLECSYDELSPDVEHNRILKSCLLLLHRDFSVESGVRGEIGRLLPFFEGIRPLTLHGSCFRHLQFHRNNRIYRFLLQVCELIHLTHLPEQSSAGPRRFRDILSDEKTMAVIFEKFVREFIRRQLPAASVRAMKLPWNAITDGPETDLLLPAMKTDVTIEWPDRQLIIDCKYYRDALKGQFDRQRFISGNLYQIHAYVVNKAAHPGWENVGGMLLYPVNGIRLDHRFTLHGRHVIRVATLDLNQAWAGIEKDLLGLLLEPEEDGGKS